VGVLVFFNINEFLSAQRATWLLKAKKKCIDNWRHNLHLLAPNNDVLLCRLRDVCQRNHPVLYGIVSSYVDFYSCFSKDGKNYWDSQIFENDIFRDPETNNVLTEHFFGREFYNNNVTRLRELTYRQCVTEHGFNPLEPSKFFFEFFLQIWRRGVLLVQTAKSNWIFAYNKVSQRNLTRTPRTLITSGQYP
jgi:hypothetical protein